MKSWLSSFGIYLKRSILAQFILGIPSGLPLALTASTLTVWLTEAGISKSSIGIFAAVAIPYSLKFLWAPLLDGSHFPLLGCLGRRRSWMLATQLAMAAALVGIAFSNPADTPHLTGLFAFFLAFCSASHDIVKDAYRVEVLPVEEQGAGAAAFVLGYRIGMIVSTAGALYLASFTDWQMTYSIMALVLLLMAAQIFFLREPEEKPVDAASKASMKEWIRTYVIMPFIDFLGRKQAVTILLFILFYRMTDAFLGVMANPFYLELGFSKIEIAQVVKLYGLVAVIIGSIVGGAAVFRLGVVPALWLGGVFSSLSNLMFVWQAHVGAEPYALALTISLDNLSAGVATSAFVAYMGSLVNVRFTGTQFALLSSFSAFGRTWLSTPSGYAAEKLGWDGFFILSTAIGIPALIFLWRLTATSPRAASTLK
jgi:PAT family beta-lactamase induction signal transducer AmpG